jgi:ATP-dependent Lhr-like helicase
VPPSPDQPDRRPPPATGRLTPRPVVIVDAGSRKQLDLTVEVPVEDMARLGQVVDIPSGPAAQGETRTSIWPAIHPLILDLIRAHRSTLIFVNARRLAERLANALNELAGEELVKAHHGSIAREQRVLIEDALKAGTLPAMVATSSLELGIDMGAIDLVIQVEAPPSVASAIQRTGRAGHQIDTPSKSIILPKFRGDLLACAALTRQMLDGEVEPLRMPRNPLDVLAQQLQAMVALDERTADELESVVRRAAPFADLPRAQFDGVLDMLSGRYPSDAFAELKPRLTWDRLSGAVTPRDGTRRIAVTNGGTIPDRGLYGVFLQGSEGDDPTGRTSRRVGELDEEMVFESRPGETFVLGASTWRIEEITYDRVLVSPAPGQPGKMPFWHGDGPGRPVEFGRAIGALCRRLRALPPERAEALLTEEHCLTPLAAANLLQYLADQAEATGAVPDDRTLVVERYMDDMGDWRVCLLSPFGSRVHAPWAMAVTAMLRERTEAEVEVLWTDDGIVARLPESDEPPDIAWFLPDPDELEDLVIRQLGGTTARASGYVNNALFAGRFREAAARALLLPKKRAGQRAPLWQQRRRGHDLLKAAAEFGNFPIVLEAYRECLRDVFDIPATRELLREIRKRALRVVPATTRTPSPFAAALLFNYVANFMYEGDAPLAERRAQALLVDQGQLRELLGEVELRELLDPDALAELEEQLQCLTPERGARHADGLHDLLLRLGDLSLPEIRARCRPRPGDPPPEEWLAALTRARRVISLTVSGEPRFVAAEDAGRYRDALGIPPPPVGLPLAFLEFARDPVGDLVSRFARTHGPFTADQVSARLGLGIAPVLTALRDLERAGRVLHGEFRPGGAGPEWCDAGVLRVLRQRSLARLRREVEPVESPALGRLYLAWQNIGASRRGGERLVEVIEQLQGAPIPASVLETAVLPARLADYDPHHLDELTAAGAVLWVGCEALGEYDGRVALFLAEHAPLLLPTRPAGPEGDLHHRIREHLRKRGASFFQHLVLACAGVPEADLQAALWDLVWAGEVTNDTLHPLRAYGAPRRRVTRTIARRFGGRLSRGSAFPADTAGRWSLVDTLLFAEPTPTERLSARARQLLDRHGVLTREAVHAEGVEGGFAALYPVLKGMEEAGRIRRGYFVAGRGATQFALPGAVDRLRGLREAPEEPTAVVLAATDPANPYGAALPWPAPDEEEGAAPRRAARAAGALVVLVDGAPAAWQGRGERNLLTFFGQHPERSPEAVADAVAQALAALVGPGRRRSFFVGQVNGRPARDSPLGGALSRAGFTYGPRGYMRRGEW